MEQQHPRPPSYVAHNPAELSLPSVPKTDITHAHATTELTLPDLKTVLSSDYHPSSVSHDSPRSATSLPRMEPGPQYVHRDHKSSDFAATSPSEVGSAMSIDERGVRSPSISIDDPDVRIAAEALSGLSNSGSIRSPTATRPSVSSPSAMSMTRTGYDEQEPLFEMFAKAHPWVSGTINGSLSAYSTTKNYSPRFVQYGAKLWEDKIAIPVVSTVGTVGRVTGVESGFRWYYGGHTRQPSDLESGEPTRSSKRRRLEEGEMDEDGDTNDPTLEQLPAYRASKPPSYREEGSPPGLDRQQQLQRPGSSQSWSSQVFHMTSGLGVALSSASRDTLRGSLGFLAKQANHISNVMEALKYVLQEYDQARDEWHQTQHASLEKGERAGTPDQDERARRLANRIKSYSDDIWQTLQKVVASVSRYTGAALPENARDFIKIQLMSLPQRWRIVSNNQTGNSETSRGARRMIDFASEGLDMISQVSQTMQLTLASAEQWLDRVGRRRGTIETTPRKQDLNDHDMTDAPARVHDVEKQ